MTTMVERSPVSPSTELQHDLHHVANQNAQTDWPQDRSFMQSSQSNSSFSSPAMMHSNIPPFPGDSYMQPSFTPAHYSDYRTPQGIGLGVQYQGCGDRQMENLPTGGNGYSGLSYLQDDTPMTPGSSNSGEVRRTRSGRSLARSDSPQVLKGETNASRVSKPSRQRKPKSSKNTNSKTPKLEAPLSELTKDMKNIPVRDMQEWVNRSGDVRQKEVEKRNGYVTRPMNSFMLYRSAYAERTKQWCLQNNHQIVSSVSGESWPLEPRDVRDHYNELAKLERENHAKAHPSYKFSPSKTPSAARKKKGDLSEEEEEYQSSSGDPDWEWRPHGERKSNRPPRRQGREAGFPIYMSPQLDFNDAHFGVNIGLGNGPPWNMGYDTKPLPTAMSPDFFDQAYSHPHSGYVSHNSGIPVSYQQSLMPVGMPHSQPLAFSHSNSDAHISGDGQVDPMLLQVPGGSSFGQGHNEHESFAIDMKFDASGMNADLGRDSFPGAGDFHNSAFDEWMGSHGASG